jgi:hypothetical protein
VSKKEIQQFHIPYDNPTLTLRVAFTRNTEVHDHEALNLPNGDIKRDFEVESRYVRLDANTLNRHCNKNRPRTAKLSPGRGKGGKLLPKKLYVEVLGRVMLWHNNQSIEIGLEICDPEKLPYTRTYFNAFLNQK